MNNINYRHKKSENKLFDLSKFDEWFEVTYRPINCGDLKIPKIISFKEHIRIIKEKENDYTRLLMLYNDLVDAFNHLQKAFYETTGERYRRKENEVEE